MHQSLRLRCPSVEDAASVPEEFEYQPIVRSNSADPRDETSVEVETFHGDVLFDADGQAVQRTNWFAMSGVMIVKLRCSL